MTVAVTVVVKLQRTKTRHLHMGNVSGLVRVVPTLVV